MIMKDMSYIFIDLFIKEQAITKEWYEAIKNNMDTKSIKCIGTVTKEYMKKNNIPDMNMSTYDEYSKDIYKHYIAYDINDYKLEFYM